MASPEFRWNVKDLAAGYDLAAEHIHPHYLELQDAILDLLPFEVEDDFLLVDAGGGSGRLVERFLQRFSQARAVLVDPSEPARDLARKRLEPFGLRAALRRCRLQDACATLYREEPGAIVSMSAIHHLDPTEKQDFYQRCHDALRPGGIFINADEVRPEDDPAYLERCKAWAAHMQRAMDAGLVPPFMREALHGWIERNVAHFGKPRTSGDDCHETVTAQLDYLRRAGFMPAEAPWEKEMWAVLVGRKPAPRSTAAPGA